MTFVTTEYGGRREEEGRGVHGAEGGEQVSSHPHHEILDKKFSERRERRKGHEGVTKSSKFTTVWMDGAEEGAGGAGEQCELGIPKLELYSPVRPSFEFKSSKKFPRASYSYPAFHGLSIRTVFKSASSQFASVALGMRQLSARAEMFPRRTHKISFLDGTYVVADSATTERERETWMIWRNYSPFCGGAVVAAAATVSEK